MKTQNEIILDHIKKYGSITPRDAFERYDIMRLASRVSELRKSGVDIYTDIKTTKKGKRYASYRLAKEAKQ
ncbi:MAG: hypothetical protein IIX44_02250 [Clostridia bacterium]|nr:hypothetical protein [Clostridia bacterium]